MADRIQQRRDTKARWEQFNPVLLEGEVGYVLDDVNRYKIGDGIHAWNDLPFRGFDGTIVHDTGDSENAVMSQKAVTEKLSELGSEVNKMGSELHGEMVYGTLDGYLDSAGVFIPYEGDYAATTDYVRVNEGMKIKVISSFAEGNVIAWGYSDILGSEPMPILKSVADVETTYDVVVPFNVKYIRAFGRKSANVAILPYPLQNDIFENKQIVDDIIANSYNNKVVGELNGYLDADGKFIYLDGSLLRSTRYVKVYQGQKITVVTRYAVGHVVLWGYGNRSEDEAKPLIESLSDTETTYRFIIPKGINYVRAFGRNSDEVSIACENVVDKTFLIENKINLSSTYIGDMSVEGFKDASYPWNENAAKYFYIQWLPQDVECGITKIYGLKAQQEPINFNIGLCNQDGVLTEIKRITLPANKTEVDVDIIVPKGYYFGVQPTMDNFFYWENGGPLPFDNGNFAVKAEIGSTMTSNNYAMSYSYIYGKTKTIKNDVIKIVEEVVSIEEDEDLSTIISKGGKVALPNRTYYITSPIKVPSGTHIVGSGNTIFKLGYDGHAIEIEGGITDISIDGVRFIGEDTYTIPQSVNAITDMETAVNAIRNLTGIGNRKGIYIKALDEEKRDNEVVVTNCVFENFSHSGIYLYSGFGTSNRHGVKISNCFFKNSYIGLYFGFRYEYCHINNVSANDCWVGGWCESGNNNYTNCHFDENKIGFVLSGILNGNEAHSSMAACSFNHNEILSFLSIDCDNGETITGCTFYESPMRIDNSANLIFNANLFSQKDIYIVKGDKSGICAFTGNMFNKAYSSDFRIRNPYGVPTILRQNFWADGSEPYHLNDALRGERRTYKFKESIYSSYMVEIPIPVLQGTDIKIKLINGDYTQIKRANIYVRKGTSTAGGSRTIDVADWTKSITINNTKEDEDNMRDRVIIIFDSMAAETVFTFEVSITPPIIE